MRKYVEIPLEVMERLVEGKCVEGSLRRDEWTGKVTFKAYQRQSRARQERVVCQLENGWLKESPQRYKFFSSVKKDLSRRIVDVVMHRELKTAMQALEIEEILDHV
jgi:RNA-splicing ligase RtcB